MTVVIDCNVFVVCLSSRSPYHYIYRSLIEGKFDLLISDEILLEYEEIVQIKYGVTTANAFISLLKELPNVHHVIPYYKWLLIDADTDDNKYCDCAIAGKAMFIVTEDKHFKALERISFPKLSLKSLDDFLGLL
ncbi:MAG TPA: putative toxin-antitoxin system toxin component, PIN family [Puia sp.]|jgi:putative PIN family toxin of toxin-antitoxin system|nr:putative toxin-antitoxin system toxin component, PIN family [Puia sp.]